MRRMFVLSIAFISALLSTPCPGRGAELGTISGRVIWEGHDLSQTTVQVYGDARMTKLVSTGVLLNEKGVYQLDLPPGTYYIAAFVDQNGNGRMDEGDGIGIYGITDWADPEQDRKPVRVEAGRIATGIDIHITAVLASIDGKLQVVPAQLYENKPSLEEELERLATGVSGKVVFEGGPIENGLIFAYTDLSWRNRVGRAEVGPDGSFKMNLPPGRYYLLAVIDGNRSNLFDTGDLFGIYGVEDLRSKGSFPKPVLVEPRRFTEVEIKIMGRRGEGGRILPIQGEAPKVILEAKSAKLRGKVIWRGVSFDRCVVQAYRDPTLTKAVDVVGTSPDGSFAMLLPPGGYYLLAEVDLDGDGKYSAGDGLGAYGTDDLTERPPKRLELKAGDNPEVRIEISAVFTKGGQLVSIKRPREAEQPQPMLSGITGRVIWDGRRPKSALMLVSKSKDFSNPLLFPVSLNEDGSYSIDLPPGRYYVMAVIDSDSDGQADGGDGFGIYGTRNPISGEPAEVSVFPGAKTPYINIHIRGMFTDDEGARAQIEDGNRFNIRAKYGPPEDVFSYTDLGKQIEEWWYWTKGVAFKFEATEMGWALIDTEKFKPKNVEKLPKGRGFDLPVNMLYYSIDGLVWGVAPDGSMEVLGMGSYPRSTPDGSKLVYIDLDGHIRLAEADNPLGRIVVKRSERGDQPAVSPDGDFIAYIRRIGDQRKLFIRFAKTGDEIQVPSSARLMSDPTWHLSGELVAFAAAGAVEANPTKPGAGEDEGSLQRDIYCYDMVDNVIDPLVISPYDDAEPAWCPTDPDLLAFSREVDGYRQIWVIRFHKNKPPEEEQVTRYGGERPVWLPDGSGIVYERNGQIWVVDLKTKKSKPVTVGGELIYGHHPFVR